jgi:hypothetical protein
MISDATPVSTRFSAHATPAFPTRNSKPPTMPAASHCFLPGRSPSLSPRLTAHAYSSPPATRKRNDVITKTGSVRLASRMNR